eukprot:gene12440-26176_t
MADVDINLTEQVLSETITKKPRTEKGPAYSWPDKHLRKKYTDDSERCAFLVRGSSQCKNRRSAGSSVCIRHNPEFLARERELSTLPKGSRCPATSKEIKRISATQERMFNPLATPLIDTGCIGLPTNTWADIFADHTKPTHVDIGSARGRLVADLAANNAEQNFIGIEVRSVLVEEAEEKMIASGRSKTNLKNICANLLNERHRLQLEESLQMLPCINRVSILFPDPWIKHSHRMRRIIQLPVLLSIAKFLSPGGELIVISDVYDLVTEAKLKLLECNEIFKPKEPTTDCEIDEKGCFLYNPFHPFASEREQLMLLQHRTSLRIVAFIGLLVFIDHYWSSFYGLLLTKHFHFLTCLLSDQCHCKLPQSHVSGIVFSKRDSLLADAG